MIESMLGTVGCAIKSLIRNENFFGKGNWHDKQYVQELRVGIRNSIKPYFCSLVFGDRIFSVYVRNGANVDVVHCSYHWTS
jgi:hypothetical protein